MMVPTNATTLEVHNLCTYFSTREDVLLAADDASSSPARRHTLGLVDESGSGESVTGLPIMGLADPLSRMVGGETLYQGRDPTKLVPRGLRRLQGNRITMVFQDPMMTLDLVLRVDVQMIEAVRTHSSMSHKQTWDHVRGTLGLMGIPGPEERLRVYPHQFSGGVYQRAAVAIAMLHWPDLTIADEPTTALGVTIRVQILSEVQKFMCMRGTVLIWITHDLSIMAGLADEMAVMYTGRIVEHGPVNAVFDAPLYPCTMGLIDSLPSENRRSQRLRQIPGMTPNLLSLSVGCVFIARYPRTTEICGAAPEITQPLSRRPACCFRSGAQHASSQEVV